MLIRRGTKWAMAVAVVLVGYPSTVHAVEVRVCLSVVNNPVLLWDYSPTMDGRDALEDFARLDQPNSLRVPRILTRIRANGATVWGWAPVGDDGCTTAFEVEAGTSLEVDNYWWSNHEPIPACLWRTTPERAYHSTQSPTDLPAESPLRTSEATRIVGNSRSPMSTGT